MHFVKKRNVTSDSKHLYTIRCVLIEFILPCYIWTAGKRTGSGKKTIATTFSIEGVYLKIVDKLFFCILFLCRSLRFRLFQSCLVYAVCTILSVTIFASLSIFIVRCMNFHAAKSANSTNNLMTKIDKKREMCILNTVKCKCVYTAVLLLFSAIWW